MRSATGTALRLGVVVLVALAGFATGWYLHPNSSPSSAGEATLSVIAAGSLAPILPAYASAFANATPGVVAPLSAQLYEGSTTAATTLADGHQPYDLFISADFGTIPKDLEAASRPVATWEIVFAADPLVLAYSPTDPALSGITSANWAQKLDRSGVLLGVPNASADPLGYNDIFALELEDAALGAHGALYSHFFNGVMGAFATPTSSTVLVSETVAGTALSSGEVDAFLIYRSYAMADRLPFVALSSDVDLGGYSAGNVSHYATASTSILSPNGSTESKKGGPVLFALTVPNTALNYGLGVAFADYLLSNDTSVAWAADGFQPLAPPWADHPGRVPAALDGLAPQGLGPVPPYL